MILLFLLLLFVVILEEPVRDVDIYKREREKKEPVFCWSLLELELELALGKNKTGKTTGRLLGLLYMNDLGQKTDSPVGLFLLFVTSPPNRT
jgi:hypothetical protein